MSQHPRISVIVPVYNGERYLRDCLDSLVRQTLKDIEIVCVDDASTDATPAILREYAAADPRVRVITEPVNGALIHARQVGTARAEGAYILFVDADDWLEPDGCAAAYDAIEREGTDILQFGVALEPEATVPERSVRWFREFARPRCRRLEGAEILPACFVDRQINWNVWNKIYAAPLMKKVMEQADFPGPVIHAEDLYVTFVALYHAASFTGIPRELYHYRYGAGVTGRTGLKEYDRLRAEALVERRLDRFLREAQAPEDRWESYRGAVRAMADDSVGKLLRLGEEDRPEGLRRLLDWWGDSPCLPMLRRRAEDALALCLDGPEPTAPGCRDTVPVVFAANDAYVPRLAVTVESLREHAAPDREYRLYVLHESIPKARTAQLESLSGDNLTVRCLNVSGRVTARLKALPTLAHISHETYFRFFIPEMFPQYDKLLYLDCDLVAEADVGALFDTPLGGALLAGAENICYPRTVDRLARDFCIDPGRYINAGVLVLNNRLLREERVQERFFRFLDAVDPKLLGMSDQDVLNAVCRDRIVYLDPAWNFGWHQCCGEPEYVKLCRGNAERTRPLIRILHFASALKPWARPELELADRYWHYAKASPLFRDILTDAMASAPRRETPAPAPAETDPGEAERIRASASYRIGRLITWAPRKLRGLFRCLRDNGWSYTWRRALEHLGIPMGVQRPRTVAPVLPAPAESAPPPPAPPVRTAEVVPAPAETLSEVSVVIPVYNAEATLPQCLDSLLAQSRLPREILCVDDGSTDGSAGVIRAYAARDSRIRLISQPNRYAGAARNNGMAQAKGTYLCFLDADDFFAPGFLEAMARQADRTEADVTVCRGWQYRQDTGETLATTWQLRPQVLRGYEVFSRRELPEELFLFTSPEPWNKLFRRSFVEENGLRFQSLPRANDVLFTYSALAAAERITTVNEPLVYNRRGTGTNLQANNARTPLAFCQAFSALRTFLEERGLYAALARSYANVCLDNTLYQLSTLRGEARETLTDYLRREGFDRFNISGHSRAYFYRRADFDEYRKIVDPEQAPRTRAYYESLPPEKYPEELILWYESKTGEELPLDAPVTFNEKLQWLKLYDATPLKTRLADKVLVRDWVAETIGEEYLIPLLGVWDRFDDIDFDALPDRFVLKTNHGSGWNRIVKDKAALDIPRAKADFDRWMGIDFAFLCGFELHYTNIPRKILAEQYMENLDQLYDYKFLCFDGRVKLIWVDTDRFIRHRRTLFTTDWQRLDATIGDYPPADRELPRPVNLEKMIALAETLSRGFAHVRVDFYEVDGRIYFGEMTFTSTSGLDRAQPRALETEMGGWLTLPEKQPIPEKTADA